MDQLFEIPLGEWADAFVDWLTAVFGGLFGLLGDGLRSLNDLVESGLTVAPWWLMIALLGLLALVARGWKLALGSVLGLLVIYGVGQWDNAMATLAPMPAWRLPCAPNGVTQTTLPATGRRSLESGRVSSTNTSSPRK